MNKRTEPSIRDATVRVWVVEDHDLLRKSLLRLCQPSRGLDCSRSFSNAETMLAGMRKASAEELPQVLLLDVGLPGRSGLEVIGEALELAPECRVVILTVFEDEAKIKSAISAGACGYLVKTSKSERIVEAIYEAAQGGSPMSPKVAASVVRMLAGLTKKSSTISLSPREHEILGLIVQGETAKEISTQLGVSVHTIDTHTRNLFKKMGVHSRAAAVAKALNERLV